MQELEEIQNSFAKEELKPEIKMD
ncbi:MAG: hypothetical protein UT23_C0014G0001, partial [Candidatus Woesebacteria bacterium GW2011_GWA1_39_12]